MNLRTSLLGQKLIKAFEQCKLKVYKCPAGKWTIGYGHTTGAGGDILPTVTANTPALKDEAAANALFLDDLDRFEDRVEGLVADVSLTEMQFDALVSLAFNIGIPNFTTSTLLKKVLAEDFEAVPAQFMRWNKASIVRNGKRVKEELAGLTRRRRAEAALWRGDLEECEKYAQMDFGEMPQDIAPPEPPKSMAKSSTGNTAIAGIVGTGAVAVKEVVDAVQPAIEPAQQVAASAVVVSANAKVAVIQTVDIWTRLGDAAPWVLLSLVIAACFGYVWFDRRRKLHDEGV